jgi:hypothetical protein
MKTIQRPIWACVIFLTLSVFACVTINIYFPAEKVESVAGEIVQDIRGKESGEEDRTKDKDSLLQSIRWAFFPTLVWAEDVTTVSNPTIRALKERMRSRFPKMKPYLQKGMLNEGDDGYVKSGNMGGIGLKEKRDIKALMDAENRDRESLYREVAKAMKIESSQINRIAEIFAKEWQKSVR